MARSSQLRSTLSRLVKILKRFWPYVRQERWLLGGAFGALFAQVFTKLLEPWPLKIVFDGVLLQEDLPILEALRLSEIGTTPLLVMSSLGLVAVVGLRALLQYFTTIGFALSGNRILTTIRAELYAHLQRLPLSYHTRAKGGDLTIRVISDIGMLKEIIVTAFLPLLGNVIILLGMLTVMLIMNWRLTLVATATFPLFWLVSQRQSKRIHKASRKQREREGAMASTAAESLGAIKLVQSLALEPTFSKSFSHANQKSLRDGVKVKRLSAQLERGVDILVAIATALVLWYGARLVLQAALTPGDLLVFVSYLKNAFKPMRDFAKYTARLAKAVAAGDRVLEVLDSDLTIRDHPDAVRAPRFKGTIGIHKVSFAYDEVSVLDNLSLNIPAGSSVALVGASGSGKSTLASLISRLYDPTSGYITIDSVDIRGFTVRSLRQQISVVLQENVLFSGTIFNNIAFGLKEVNPDAVVAAAQLAQAHDFITKLPAGYETVVGERGETLSGGQRQRLAVARAALRQAPILILDEPTVALDEDNARLVTAGLERLFKIQTTLIITHDLMFASKADQVVYLEQGRIVEQGTHHDLMQLGGRYARLFTLQTQTAVPEVAYAV
jgi:ATP-binding cassette, subfamily B, bacterial